MTPTPQTFEELGLPEKLLKALKDLGFTEATPVQAQTIPLLQKQKTDLVALAQTGTGKTAAFGLPLLSETDFSDGHTKALILAPTRELCMQISADLKKFAKYMPNVKVTEVYGGASIEGQIRTIKQGTPGVIAATPGRLIDLMKRKVIDLKNISVVILDEADEMLNMGFKDSIDEILEKTPEEKNVWLFSATMPKEVARIASSYMKNPAEISVGKKNEGAANIEHLFYQVQSREKYLVLKRVMDYNPDIYGIIFCRTRIETQEVADNLIKDGYSADALHGDLSQGQRDFVMKRYRGRALQMLVATDVAARGLDVKDVTHVINYSLPEDVENYTHRSGRTARAGKAGVSIAFVTAKDIYKIRDIEKIINKKFTQAVIPTGVEVCERQLFHVAEKIQNAKVNEEEIAKYLPKIYEQLNEISKEDLIKRFVSEEFNRFLEYYQQAPDLNQKGGAGLGSNSKMSRFFINLGELDGLHWKFLKDYLADISGISALHIFNVDVKKSFSFFETETKDAQKFLDVNAKELKFNDRKVQIEASSGGERMGRSSSESRGEGGYKRREGGGSSSGSRSGGSGRSSSGGYAGKREGGAYPKRSSDSASTGYKRRESEGGGSGYKRRESSSEGSGSTGGGYKRKESSEGSGSGFKRRDSDSSSGGGFKKKESVDGGFKKSFDKPAGGSRPRTKRSFND
jgi:ATP-dependent RNA helicase DeaD